MNGPTPRIVAACAALFAMVLISNRLGVVEGQQKRTPGEGFAAVPGLKGGQDVFGPYDPVQNWPRPLAESLPNHDGWTWSQATDVFAESPDRVFMAQKGELPVLSGRMRDDMAAAARAEPQVPGWRRPAATRGRQRDPERRAGARLTAATAVLASTGDGST